MDLNQVELTPRQKSLGMLAVAGASTLSGGEGVLTQLCYANGFNYFTVLSMRYCLACLVFLIVVLVTKSPLVVQKEYRLRTFLIGMLLVGSAALLNLAFRVLPATVAILFFYSYLLMTGLSAKLVFKKRLGWMRVVALGLSALGLILLYWSSFEDVLAVGVLFALGAGLVHTVKMNLSETFSNQCNPLTYTFNILVVCSVVFSGAALVTGSYVFQVQPIGWVFLLILGVVMTSGGNIMFFWGLGQIGSVDTSIVFLLEPIASAVVAYIAFRDTLAPLQVLGGVLSLSAVFFPVLANLKKPSPAAEKETPTA